MSGYPYGNPVGGYPPFNTPNYNAYPNYPPNGAYTPPPPPIPVYPDNQSFAPPYGMPAPHMPSSNNYFPTPYNGNQMPSNTYDYIASSNYPLSPPTFSPPAQQHEGFGNSQYQSSSASSGLYPSLSTSSTSTITSNPFEAAVPSTSLASLEQYQGTVFPAPNFNADADCQALRQAMKGLGTNERALIDIVVNRSNAQRQQIKFHYKSMYGIDLMQQISGEISGNFKETVHALFDAPADFDARSLNQALNGGGEGTLREILLTRTNSEIRAIVEAYRRMYSKDLEKEITNRVSGNDFKRILVSAVQANRDELTQQQIQQARQMGIESIIDRNRACQDADSLYKAGAGKWGTDEKTFNAIFAQRNYYQLRATFEEYQKKYRQDITKVIKSEFSGNIEESYLVLIACIRDRPSFFAERIQKAVKGLGTNDSALIRVIVTRSEIDLAQIKERYQVMYKHSLAQDVADDTSGDYKQILLSIIK